MIPELEALAMPRWLSELSKEAIAHEPFPLAQVLDGSFYYPACGSDGRPVEYFAGNTHSFIYADYGVSKDQLERDIADHGFAGYEPLAVRYLRQEELAPDGWTPKYIRPDDGDPSKYRDWICPPYAAWVIFERLPNRGSEHGPERFSLLYICGDGAATYQALYEGNRSKPLMIAVIQPGDAFGGNWTRYDDPNGLLARSVRGNPFGMPDYLVCGGAYPSPKKVCWPDYPAFICHPRRNTDLGLWGRPRS